MCFRTKSFLIETKSNIFAALIFAMKLFSFIAAVFILVALSLGLHAQSDAMKDYAARMMANLRANPGFSGSCDCTDYNMNSNPAIAAYIELDGETYEVSNDARWMLGQLNRLTASEKCCLLNIIRKTDWAIPVNIQSAGLPFSITDFGLAITGLKPDFSGQANSYGIWGLPYLAGVAYPLHIDSVYDERMNPAISAMAAAKYLRQLHETFGVWSLAIYAYAEGPAAVRRLTGSGKLSETPLAAFDAFVACILFTNIHQSFMLAGISHEVQAGDTVIVNRKLHIRQISDYMSIPEVTIRAMNPEIIGDIIYGNLRPVIFRLPAGYAQRFNLAADSIANYRDTVFFPKPKPAVVNQNDAVARTSPGADYEKTYYTIQSGDNLGAIAEKMGVSVADLKDWNDISGTKIYAGKKLVIYVKKGSTVVKPETKPAEKPAEIKKPETPSVLQGYILKDTYTVQKGDSPYTIAKKYPGVSAENIMEWNGISNPSQLQIGQKLKIYGKK